MATLTTCLLRRPAEIVAIETSVAELDLPKYESPFDRDLFSQREVSLESVIDLNRDYLEEIASAWQRLARVGQLNQSVTADIATVLRSTLPDVTDASVNPWHPPVAPKIVKPTAAHPRAFAGTKFQPPTVASIAPIDLRPHLCNARDVRAILSHLEAKSSGTPQDREANQHVVDAFRLPLDMRKTLWWPQLAKPTSRDHATGIYWDLDLEANDALRKAVAFLLRSNWVGDAIDWASAIRHLPAERRAFTMAMVVLKDIVHHLPDDCSQLLSRVSTLCEDNHFAVRMFAFADAIASERSVPALLDGFALSNEYAPDFNFVNAEYDEACPIDAIEEWIACSLEDDFSDDWRCSSALSLWSSCGDFEGLSELIDQRPWRGFRPAAAFELLSLFSSSLHYFDTFDEGDAKYEIVRRNADAYFSTIRDLPDAFRCKAIEFVKSVCFDTPQRDFESAFQRCLQFASLACRRPSCEEGYLAIHVALVGVTAENFDRLMSHSKTLDAKCDWLRTIEKQAENENNAKVIARGIKHLIACGASDSVTEGLLHCPTFLMRAALSVGCLSAFEVPAAVGNAKAHPLAKLEMTDLQTLADASAQHRPESVHNPISKKVRAFVAGDLQLSKAQTQRALQQSEHELLRTQIDLIRFYASQALAEKHGVTMEDAQAAAVEHALRIHNQSEENRRALRKFLKAYWRGDRDYLIAHPANAKWLSSLRELDPQRWLVGYRMEASIELEANRSERLSITIENDPLEALRLGTYVNSCLGIGGMLAVSAAATVLDINKHVVYVRNERNKVVARQILAICESEELVPFNVYPNSASREVQRAIAQFDRQFAKHLGIPIFDTESDAHCEIAQPLSSYWWDDDAWNLHVE